jgi:hypothetical protein
MKKKKPETTMTFFHQYIMMNFTDNFSSMYPLVNSDRKIPLVYIGGIVARK